MLRSNIADFKLTKLNDGSGNEQTTKQFTFEKMRVSLRNQDKSYSPWAGQGFRDTSVFTAGIMCSWGC